MQNRILWGGNVARRNRHYLMVIVSIVSVLVLNCPPAFCEPAVVPANGIANFLNSPFARFDVIALGELHTSRADQELRIELVRNKAFAKKVGIVVVEGLNSLYQPDLDRYIQGEQVSSEQIQKVWRNSTQVFMGPVVMTAYEHFLQVIRSVNQNLSIGSKIRVIAADPPIDWVRVQSREEFLLFLRDRVNFGAKVIATEVLEKRKKALLVFGLGHFVRNQQMQTPQGVVPLIPTIGGMLDAEYPGRLYVVTAIRGGEYPNTAKMKLLIGNAKPPVLLQLKGTPFGALDPNEFVPANSSLLQGAPIPAHHSFHYGVGMESTADACIYRGQSPDALLEPDPIYKSDGAFASEIARRARIAAPPGR